MGTRADYYVLGKDDDGREILKWIGSTPMDGYPDGGIVDEVIRATSAKAFRAAVKRVIREHDGTTPEHGWPWPWKNSWTSDYAYAYVRGKVWATGCEQCWNWFDPLSLAPDMPDLPEMDTSAAAMPGDPRSGMLAFGRRAPEGRDSDGQG